jgi:hypothetical protein
MDSSPTISPSDRIIVDLRLILRGLLLGLAVWRLEPMVKIALFGRANRVFSQVERMLLRFRAGKLRRITQRDRVSGPRNMAARRVAFPRRYGWLVRAGRHEAACIGAQLQTLLSKPEMVELLAASPQAVRVLSPLCRALALDLPGTPAKEPTVSPIRVRKPRVKPVPFRIPLPRGVLTAARRQGFGKLV